ncbi:MAG TPA: VTT domain-containing protein [Dehalococcoidia bacterium]|nr:VTT domain-containing protein [Dehalococcoidia bacterium]
MPDAAPHQHHALEVEPEGLYIHVGRRRVRLEFLLIGTILAIAAVATALFFALHLGTDDLERYGYGGLFLITLLRSASVVVPMPGGGIVFAAGGLLDPAWGIPAPLLVGLTAAVAESFGELTGYGAGMGGSTMVTKRRLYKRVRGWIHERPFTTVLAMSLFPSPVFDIAGLAAGAARVPIRKFYPALLIGKAIRGITVATMGFYGIGLIDRLFS